MTDTRPDIVAHLPDGREMVVAYCCRCNGTPRTKTVDRYLYGGRDSYIGTDYSVHCPTCGSKTPTFSKLFPAIENWNKWQKNLMSGRYCVPALGVEVFGVIPVIFGAVTVIFSVAVLLFIMVRSF